ncbi:MAG: tRNA preQ1(34) S-adenosylmethionine ribosyltransferase-isomerase QueA [Dehalococcoidia bacterium]|nr:tRNA preQ1(34) S-adenosylmethionine ribosyltransferase-isomerase QueA [Chloroflexota bacterium]MCK4241957.1 tRNA preQ1(34) S-adenosylmethionine ribosyltransferase-isomerase QueA [Dehalococcoidia bacterium]
MKTSDFDYHLPTELIAQTPMEPRDRSRLMVLRRSDGAIEHRRFFEIAEFLRRGDVLVFNDSRVLPARLIGRKEGTGGKVEVLLLRRLSPGLWQTLVKPGRRFRLGTRVEFSAESGSPDALWGEVVEWGERGIRIIRFSDEGALEQAGSVPLPPYIHHPLKDPERYQTVYSRVMGSVAAPTAGLHFTPELLHRLEEKGVHLSFVTLHVGLDTFSPVRVDDPRNHPMHKEYCELPEKTAQELNQAKAEGRRIICVGTTTVRILEQAALKGTGIEAFHGWSDILILPGHCFHTLDGLITNFHLPRTTLLMLVSAFAGHNLILRAYQEAIRLGYRLYSFGDAMLIL